jgi:hypothetical protein
MTNKNPTPPENGLSDVARNLRVRSRSRYSFDLILRLYVALGIIFAAAGALYFVGSMFEIKISANQRLALIFAGSGLTVSVLSWLLLNYRRAFDRYQTEEYLSFARRMEVVEAWQEFEETSRRLLRKDGEDFQRYSLRSMIDALRKDDVIDIRDFENLRSALDVRNLIVHRNLQLDVDASRKWAEEIARINQKLAQRLASSEGPMTNQH